MDNPQHQPELRRDPITAEWVILAAGRGKRPQAPTSGDRPIIGEEDCPFCEGREHLTPPEICACRELEGCDCPGWTVRVLPNKYPIFVSSAERAGLSRTASFHRRPALGTSEVIVDSHIHNLTPWQLGSPQVQAMLEIYRDRIETIKRERSASYVLIIRNHKAAAASSLEHPHSQLFGLPFIPSFVDVELDGFVAAHPGEPGCVLCDIIADEVSDRSRLVLESENFIAFCPFASRQPYETWVAPKRHMPRFERCDELAELAELLTELLNRFHDRLDDPPFNYWLHTYPLHGEVRPFHWHLEIMPRLTLPGGLEMGAGIWVNTVAPDAAAAFLRD